MGGMGGMGGGTSLTKRQDPPVVHDLQVTLEEVFSGCVKKMKISHQRLNPDRRSWRTQDKILEVEIKKGWKEGTKITFPKEGDETPTNIPADVVFVLKDKPHPVFRRDGADIIYPAKVSLRDVRLYTTLNYFFTEMYKNGMCGHTFKSSRCRFENRPLQTSQVGVST